MKKIFLFTTLLSAMLLGCGEAGFESDISKVTEVSYTFTSEDFSYDGFLSFGFFDEIIDPAGEDFEDYLDDIDEYFINKIEVEVKEINTSTPVNIYAMNISVENMTLFSEATDDNHPTLDVLTDNIPDQVTLTNILVSGRKAVLYDRQDNANGVISDNNAALNNILTALRNRQSFRVRIENMLFGKVEGSFELLLHLDLTARTKLD